MLLVGCCCARNGDGSRTTLLCPKHAEADPCATKASITGKRRKGTIRRGRCTNCGHERLTNQKEEIQK